MTGRHDLIGSSRSVEIFAAARGSSTSGSKAYFLFKLHDPTSGESGRQQQLTTRLSSCILDMCDGARGQRGFLNCLEKLANLSPPVLDLQAFSRSPKLLAWVYYGDKLIEDAIYCFIILIITCHLHCFSTCLLQTVSFRAKAPEQPIIIACIIAELT